MSVSISDVGLEELITEANRLKGRSDNASFPETKTLYAAQSAATSNLVIIALLQRLIGLKELEMKRSDP